MIDKGDRYVVSCEGQLNFTAAELSRGMIPIPDTSPFFAIDNYVLQKLLQTHGKKRVLNAMGGIPQ